MPESNSQLPAPTFPSPIVMTAAEVAGLLRVAVKTVYKLKDCDGLPCRRFGGSVRFYQHEVLDWMENQPASRSTTQGD